MKLSQSLEKDELSGTVLSSIQDHTENQIDELIQKFNDQLHKKGKYLSPGDIKRLKPILRGEMKIKMSISTSLTFKLLSDCEIYVTSATQTFLVAPTDEKEGEKA